MDGRRQVTQPVRIRSGADTREIAAEMLRRLQVRIPAPMDNTCADQLMPFAAQPRESAFLPDLHGYKTRSGDRGMVFGRKAKH